MTGSTKVLWTVVLFLIAVATVVLAAAIHRAYPLFVAWVPLIGVGRVLTRPEEPVEEPPTLPSASPDES